MMDCMVVMGWLSQNREHVCDSAWDVVMGCDNMQNRFDGKVTAILWKKITS